MLGIIFHAFEAFIKKRYGEQCWEEILLQSRVQGSWLSSCPYSDDLMLQLAAAVTEVLGVPINDVIEEYGVHFVHYTEEQGYGKLMRVLGSNMAEFFENLNSLHLTLSMGWPSMKLPSFRCEQVTAESLLLHYYSVRRGMWPLVVGILKAVAEAYFGFELVVQLIASRDVGDDHEIFRLTYPYQEDLCTYDKAKEEAAASLYSMPTHMFYKLHPFHLLMAEDMTLLQVGPAVQRIMPTVGVGDSFTTHFKVGFPYIPASYPSILEFANSSFLLTCQATMLELLGQMLPVPLATPSGGQQRALLFLGSPRCCSLSDMQAQKVFLSDIPLHDMSRGLVILGEHRQAEADLKDQYERLNVELMAEKEKLAEATRILEEEKARADALLQRMSALIACLDPAALEHVDAGTAEAATAAAEAVLGAGKEGGSGSGSGSNGSATKLTAAAFKGVQEAETCGPLSSVESTQPGARRSSANSNLSSAPNLYDSPGCAEGGAVAAAAVAVAAAAPRWDGAGPAVSGCPFAQHAASDPAAACGTAAAAAAARMARSKSEKIPRHGNLAGEEGSQPSVAELQSLSYAERIEAVRRELSKADLGASSNSISCCELLGEGTFGKVYKGLWRGSIVAVKTIILPAMMSGAEKREKMALTEAAISSALSHPNILQTYTYDIHPLCTQQTGWPAMLMGSAGRRGGGGGGASGGRDEGAHSFELRLVLEYCDMGSLRDAVDGGAFLLKVPAPRTSGSSGTGSGSSIRGLAAAAAAAAMGPAADTVNYKAVLDTAIEVASALVHLHGCNVLHADLKARNIMLKSAGAEGRGVTSKVADFGLSAKMDNTETHMSNVFQGTMSHMSPEVLVKGYLSKAADVYAFGIVMWELYTGGKPFANVPHALLGHYITQLNKRPEFPPDTPKDYVRLAMRCWDAKPSRRPKMDHVLAELNYMRSVEPGPTEPLSPYDLPHSLATDNRGTPLTRRSAPGNLRRGAGGPGEPPSQSTEGTSYTCISPPAPIERLLGDRRGVAWHGEQRGVAAPLPLPLQLPLQQPRVQQQGQQQPGQQQQGQQQLYGGLLEVDLSGPSWAYGGAEHGAEDYESGADLERDEEAEWFAHGHGGAAI